MASILKINTLQREIDSTKAEINNLSTRIINDVGAIYSNVDEMLKQKASLIESAATEIGAVNVDDFTAPVTFTLTPKEVSDRTTVSLDFDGELFPMEKNGTTFFATVSRSIFGNALPKIVIDENGVKKTMQDNQIGILSIKDETFPILSPMLMGEARYDSKTYRWKGNLHADVKEVPSGIEFKEIRFVIKVDDKVFSNKTISNATLSRGYEVDEKIPLDNGQTCEMTVIATDNIGLKHRYIIDHLVAGSGEQWAPPSNEEPIYSADGKLLWKSE